MRIWVTKYALNPERGIERYDDADIGIREGRGGDVRVARVIVDGKRVTFIGVEWWESEEDAIARAEHMRVTEVANLRRKIRELEGMRFGAKEAA